MNSTKNKSDQEKAVLYDKGVLQVKKMLLGSYGQFLTLSFTISNIIFRLHSKFLLNIGNEIQKEFFNFKFLLRFWSQGPDNGFEELLSILFGFCRKYSSKTRKILQKFLNFVLAAFRSLFSPGIRWIFFLLSFSNLRRNLFMKIFRTISRAQNVQSQTFYGIISITFR